ncbi:hypothetical protein H6G76_27175 [Nostoc sp. FACHB-152]|uniref:hypothetical protein n=1 Tax=unclassified Nostoc TaxID=2593658 RepID=UPI00168976D3|nr:MULTISPECIES: hypothetical protein [unclassified Nostoc]MBD2450744.1 hypothetical protein [Nostoc sp. FACHB-152]MBD2471956.1 hypothetical protein [Nostoc sp. FACHB-145]
MVREYSPQTQFNSPLENLPPLQSGDRLTRSQVFPGLWLEVEALLNNQMAWVLEVL